MQIFVIISLAVALMAIAFICLAIQIVLKKGGKFPNTHVGGNPYLQKHGISCAKTQDRIEQSMISREIDFKRLKIVGVDKGSIQL